MTLKNSIDNLIDGYGLPAVLQMIARVVLEEADRCDWSGHHDATNAYGRVHDALKGAAKDARTATLKDPVTR